MGVLLFLAILAIIFVLVRLSRLNSKIERLTRQVELLEGFSDGTQNAVHTDAQDYAHTQAADTEGEQSAPTMTDAARDRESTPAYANRMAGKVFSWIGGFLLFLGVVFAIKYSIENDLISPLLRVAAALLCGLALIAASYIIRAEKYKATSDTLCAAGLAILYGSIISSRHYNFLSITAAFLMMGGVSMASFWLASNRKAQYIGFLGAASGFLVPLILNSGSQNYLVLFAYLAIISAGAIGAGVKEGWNKLIATSLSLALLFQLVWFAPRYNPAKIIDFCIIFSSYVFVAAGAAWFFRKRLSLFSKKCFAFYITLSFLLIFLTDFSLMAIGLAFFVNLVLAALFYSDSNTYNIPFRIVNVAAFLLLACWTSSYSGKGENTIVLLLASLAFTALNTLVSMAKKSSEDTFGAALPLGALLLLLFMPTMDFWAIYAFALVVASGAIVAAFRANSSKIALFASAIFALFMVITFFSQHRRFGALDAAVGELCAIGLLCAVAFGNFLKDKGSKVGFSACLMPFLFISLFMLDSGPDYGLSSVGLVSLWESWDLRMLLGLIFCAATVAVILLISQYKRNGQYPLPTAFGASVPLLIASPNLVGLGQGSALCLLVWALFFFHPFFSKSENRHYLWAASSIMGAALLVGALLNLRFANLAAAAAIVAVGYGAAAAWERRGPQELGSAAAKLYIPLAWASLFVFVNVLIAHFFEPKAVVAFGTNGSLAKTIAYTLAWGVYGMATIFLGTRAKGRWGLIAGIALVSVALLKLFLSDFWMLNTLHRVIVLIGMAAILIAGSFAYQALQRASATKRST